MDIRRVVTGHDADGKAIFVSDEEVEPVTVPLLPGMEFHQLWGADSTPTFPDSGSKPEAASAFPPVDGFRFGFFTISPHGAARAPEDRDFGAPRAGFEQKLPGLAQHLEPDEPGMHTSATIDYGVVLSGQATLELDDGAQLALNAGDAYIQNGTRHRWSNTGSIPAVVAVAILGAHHQKVG